MKKLIIVTRFTFLICCSIHTTKEAYDSTGPPLQLKYFRNIENVDLTSNQVVYAVVLVIVYAVVLIVGLIVHFWVYLNNSYVASNAFVLYVKYIVIPKLD